MMDLIDRQAAINVIQKWKRYETTEGLIDRIKELPSTQPEQGDFEKQLHDMFDHIWNCEIDHPVFQDTVGDLMRAVIEAHYRAPQQEITPDGTLKVTVDADIANVGRILLSQTGTQYGGLYYKDEQPEPKWIPCKERLPDKDGLYLVTYFSGHARWTGTDEFLVDGTEESHWKYANIIAWQPLPKPFREGGDYA